MKKFRFLFPLWLTLALALGAAALRAADEQPAPPPAPAPAEQPAVDEPKPADVPPAHEAPAAVEAPAAPAEPATPESKPADAEPGRAAAEAKSNAEEKPLRELGSNGETAKAKSDRRRPRSYGAGGRSDGDFPLGSHHLSQGSRSGELVSIFGSSTVDGDSNGDAVSIFGHTTVNGSVEGAAVSVLGSTTVKGTVGGEAVAVLGDNKIDGRVKGEAVVVMGDMHLGPEASVDGDVIVVGGKLHKEPGARIKGSVEEISIPIFHGFGWLHAYLYKCVLWGRLLWFGENLGWAWMVAGGFLVFYLLLALVFPRGVDRCAEVLEKRPGASILAALLTAVLSPILTFLLILTGIGIALVPVVGGALLVGTLFGKVAILSWFGRRVLGVPPEGGQTRHTLLTVLVGGLIVCLIYCVPVLGMLLYKLLGALGLGMVVFAVSQAMKREKPASRPPFAAAGVPAGAAGFVSPAHGAVAAPSPEMPVAGFVPPAAGTAPEAAGFVPPAAAARPRAAHAQEYRANAPAPEFSAATLPRVGFWLRFGASFLDFILVGIATAILGNTFFNIEGPGLLFLGFATYCAVMWKTKGTTIGGVICGLRVVRIDDRPIDWSIAIVRALSGFLSFFAAGLGFIWVVFDDDKQSWHDKIAGTTIVRVPKGTPLL